MSPALSWVIMLLAVFDLGVLLCGPPGHISGSLRC